MDRFLGDTLLDRYGSIIKRDTNETLKNKKSYRIIFLCRVLSILCRFYTKINRIL